jgi:hypothetical protein
MNLWTNEPWDHWTVELRKSMKISKSVNRRTDNTMTERTNNDLQKNTHKTKDRVTQIPLTTGGELGCSGRVRSSCSTIIETLLNIPFCPFYFVWSAALDICDTINTIIRIALTIIHTKLQMIQTVLCKSYMLFSPEKVVAYIWHNSYKWTAYL